MSTTNWPQAPRVVTVTARTPGMVTGRTPLSANLGLTPSEHYWRGRNQREALIPNNWADLKPAQMQARRDRLHGVNVEAKPKVHKTTVRKMTESERMAEIDKWTERAARMLNPARFILTEVPEVYRAEVVARAAS